MVVFSIDSYALALFSVSSGDSIKIQTSCDEFDLIRSKLCIPQSLSDFIKTDRIIFCHILNCDNFSIPFYILSSFIFAIRWDSCLETIPSVIHINHVFFSSYSPFCIQLLQIKLNRFNILFVRSTFKQVSKKIFFKYS